MVEPKFRRVLLKISGEAMAGDQSRGLDFNIISDICDVVGKCVKQGVQLGIVVGGGNFWRGVKDGGGAMERVRADHMGMLATVMNCIYVFGDFPQCRDEDGDFYTLCLRYDDADVF